MNSMFCRVWGVGGGARRYSGLQGVQTLRGPTAPEASRRMKMDSHPAFRVRSGPKTFIFPIRHPSLALISPTVGPKSQNPHPETLRLKS